MYSERVIESYNSILRAVLSTGKSISLVNQPELTTEILSLAKAQDTYLLVCDSIKKAGGVSPILNRESLSLAVYQYVQNNNLLKRVRETLTEQMIPYIPLKGIVVRDLFPQPWMRSSCDIDILVHEQDLSRAVQSLVAVGFSTNSQKGYHDISLYYGDAHLELHYNICESIPRIDVVLSQVWNNTRRITDYEYREKEEFFVYHSIAHLLYHFLRGGCNIKQFLDLWLLRINGYYEEEALLPLLSISRLVDFYNVICEMTDIWFGGKEPTAFSRELERWVIAGGLLRSKEQTDVVDRIISGGLCRYIMNSLFPPIREMKWMYPSLEKHPVFLPAYYLRRMWTKSFGKDKNMVKQFLKTTRKPQSEIEALLRDIGLS